VNVKELLKFNKTLIETEEFSYFYVTVSLQFLLTPAIQAYLIGLIYRNTRTTCLSLSALCPWVSHDTLCRLLGCALSWSGRLWEVFACRLVKEGGYLVIDDTAWQRWAKRAEAVSPVWCTTLNKVLLGMQVVLLIWTDGKWKGLLV